MDSRYSDPQHFNDEFHVRRYLQQLLRCGATLNAHTNWVETLQHDGNYMYSGSQDMTIRKWRRSALQCATVLRGHEKGVLSLKLLGGMLFAGDRKGEIKLWKARARWPRDDADAMAAAAGLGQFGLRALAVALELAVDVGVERLARAECVDHYGMIDDQIDRR